METSKGLVNVLAKYLRKEVLLIIVVIVAMRYVASHSYLDQVQMQHLAASWGILAPLAFIAICGVIIPAFVPPMLFIFAGAMAFGQTLGAIYSLVGITAGACFAFLLGKYAATDLANRLKGRKRLRRLDAWVARNGLVCVLGLRLALFSSPALSYACSATALPFKDFALGTFFGLIPRTFLISYFFQFLLLRVHSFHDIFLNPYVVILPLTRIIGLLVLAAFAKGSEVQEIS